VRVLIDGRVPLDAEGSREFRADLAPRQAGTDGKVQAAFSAASDLAVQVS
jgi:hypothetical protein